MGDVPKACIAGSMDNLYLDDTEELLGLPSFQSANLEVNVLRMVL